MTSYFFFMLTGYGSTVRDKKEKNTQSSKRSPLGYLILTLKGFCMGASDIVPGVSGGTMAFILGIYQELVDAIRSFDLKCISLMAEFRIREVANHVSWRFLLSVGVGVLIAILTMAGVLTWLLENTPVLIWSFFFGLITGSVLAIGRHVQAWRSWIWLFFLLGTAGTYVLVGLVPVSTPDAPWFLFLSGAVAICAMILPGISGAFILVLLGKYRYILEAVNHRDLTALGLVLAGACVGIAAFSRLLGWLYEKYREYTVALLTGLVLGSLRKIWPWKEAGVKAGEKHISSWENVLPPEWNSEVWWAFTLMGVGFLVVLLLERMGGKSDWS